MYEVSDAYREAIRRKHFKNRIYGTLTLTTGEEYEITDACIIPGGLKITNQCANGKDFTFGSVYAGQLSLKLYGLNFSRYRIVDAKVVLSYFLELSDGSEEEVPLGEWYVSTATMSKKILSLVCYDAMLKLDEPVYVSKGGYPWDMLKLIEEKCGVEIANSREDIESAPNGLCPLILEQETVNTYREILSYVTAILGRFATVGRDGRLYLKEFDNGAGEPLDASQRTSSTIADYKTNYQRVKMQVISDGKYVEYSVGPSNKTIVDLGQNPLLRGSSHEIMTVLSYILPAVQEFSYCPAKFSIVPDPSWDLGDMILATDVNYSEDDARCLINQINFTYHGACELVSVGVDPALALIKNKTAKSIKNGSMGAGGGNNFRISEVNRNNASQITVVATDGIEVVSNVWNITHEDDITIYTNMADGNTITFAGWDDE